MTTIVQARRGTEINSHSAEKPVMRFSSSRQLSSRKVMLKIIWSNHDHIKITGFERSVEDAPRSHACRGCLIFRADIVLAIYIHKVGLQQLATIRQRAAWTPYCAPMRTLHKYEGKLDPSKIQKQHTSDSPKN